MKYIKSVVLSLLVTLLFAMPGTVFADVNDFKILSFDADYTLSNTDKQGRLQIIENIAVDFADNNHGILRAIPSSYKGTSLDVRIKSVSSPSSAPSEYTTSKENGNIVLKIGSPTKTVTGKQTYKIEYEVSNVIGFYDDHDELYWDINGDQWAQSADEVSVIVHLDQKISVNKTKCFAGAYGDTADPGQETCVISTSKEKASSIQSSTTAPLAARQTLTIVAGLEKGYFTAPTFADWLKDHALLLISIAMPPLLVGSWLTRRWYLYGKDLKGRGVIVPEYAAPDKLTPAEVGMIYDYKLDQKDVSATIIDLAIKKHLIIIETKEKKILKDKTTYSFKRLASDTTKLMPHELKVLQGIFPDLKVGSEVPLSSLANKFHVTVSSVQKTVPVELTAKGYFVSDPTKAGAKIVVLACILPGIAFFIHHFISIGLALAALIAFGFAALMPKRSIKGVVAKDAIEGLKLYMNTAEKERLAMLQSVDAKYAPKTTEPQKTVDLFEKLLPYAMVLGVEATWAKQFEGIYTTPPDWYRGSWNSFNAIHFASHLNSSVSAMSTSFAPPSSSGSSGFGGGGFSGGGGGGGGGGGW